MQKGGKIAENILAKGVLFNSQNDDGVPIFHGSAGTRGHVLYQAEFNTCSIEYHLFGIFHNT